MGKVLRILVVVVLVLGSFALWLAIQNFNKRELLIGRTHQLEESFIKVAKTLEAQDAPDVPQPVLPSRDASPVTSRELENPELSIFWDSYEHKLEPSTQPIPTLDFGTEPMRIQLRNLYQQDGLGNNVLDLNGKPKTDGTGTMRELLDLTLARATAQSAVLGKTRAELLKVREELSETIEELNAVKKDGRKDKKTIEDLNARITQLESEKQQLERQKERLEEQIRELNAELAEAKDENDKARENINDLELQVNKLKAENARLIQGERRRPDGQPVTEGAEGKFTPGTWGKVVSVNEQWKFAVIELQDSFMVELLGPERDQAMPQIQMMVRREGLQTASGDFVTRIRLRQVIREQNLVVADIMTDWQQVPVEPGDIVYF